MSYRASPPAVVRMSFVSNGSLNENTTPYIGIFSRFGSRPYVASSSAARSNASGSRRNISHTGGAPGGIGRAHGALRFGYGQTVLRHAHTGDAVVGAHAVDVVLDHRDAGRPPPLDGRVQLRDRRLVEAKRLVLSVGLCGHDVVLPVSALGRDAPRAKDSTISRARAGQVVEVLRLTIRLSVLVLSLLLASPGQLRAASEGTMTWGVHASLAARWLDPAETEGTIIPFMMLYALHDALLKPMPAGLNTPSLAESWTMSKDGLTYEFVLRKSSKFHNGDPVTAEDVKFSFERYRGAGAKQIKDKVRDVQVVDPGRVRFQLREPWPDF